MCPTHFGGRMPGSPGITCWRTSFFQLSDMDAGITGTGAVTVTAIGEAMDAMATGAAMDITTGGVTIMMGIMTVIMVMDMMDMVGMVTTSTSSAIITVSLTRVRPIASTLRTGLTAASATETVQEDRDGQTLPHREAPALFTAGVLM